MLLKFKWMERARRIYYKTYIVILHDRVHLFLPPSLFVVVDVDDDFFVFLHRLSQILNLAVFLFQGIFEV